MRLIKRSKSKKDLIKELEDLKNQNKTLIEKLERNLQNKTNLLSENTVSDILNEIVTLETLSIFLFDNIEKTFAPISLIKDSGFSNLLDINQLLLLIHPEDKSDVADFFKNIKTNTKQQTTEFRYYNKVKDTKEVRYSRLVCTNLKSKQEVQEIYYCYFKDISKQVKSRRELLKNQERAENADKVKTVFLSNISHFVRTPLNSIVGFAELLSISDFEKEKRKEFLHIIKNQSKNLLKIIDDVADIAKYESGLYTISKSPCNINILLNELLINNNEIRSSLRKVEVKLNLKLPNKKGYIIYTDTGRLQQIIQNLLAYSLKTTDHGHIDIGYLVPQDGKIEFFIDDSGSSISKDEQRIIFDKSLNAEITENLKYEDISLGMTIAKYMVKLLGGKIWLNTENGNSYRFIIPYETPPSLDNLIEENELDTQVQYNWRNKIILVAEDEEVNGMFIEAVLQETNSQVIYAYNGLQALELYKTLPKIDLILMDIKMPIMNGLEATQEIRKLNSKVPIIAQTAMTTEEDINSCELAGCNEVITKPIEVEQFLYTLNNYLSD